MEKYVARDSVMEVDNKVGPRERALVVGLTLAFALRAATLPGWDQPTGDAWNRYLGNAVAIAEGDWRSYQPWRGPVHAWLLLAVTPGVGTLVRAAQFVSLVAATAMLPLTWAIGRSIVGPTAAVVAVALLATSPDLVLFGRFGITYALQGALLLGGVGWMHAGCRLPPGRAELRHYVAASALLGLGTATDFRVAVLGAAACVALAPWRPRVLAVPVFAVTVATVVNALLPVPLVPLWRQVGVQRGLSAQIAECPREGGNVFEFLRSCGPTLVHRNLHESIAALPGGVVTLAVLATLAGVGLWTVGRRAAASLSLPLLALAPSFVVIQLQHRYLLPVVGFAALIVGAGLARLLRPWMAGVVVVALAVAWQAHPGSLWVQAWSPPGNTPRPGRIDSPDAASRVAAYVRANHGVGEPIVDCADIDLRERLFPIPVRREPAAPNRLTPKCVELLEVGGPGWLVVPGSMSQGANATWGQATLGHLVVMRGR